MGYFVVMRGHGPEWEPTRPMREQRSWTEHAVFMDQLAKDGFVVLGGPVNADDSRIMLVVEAADDQDIQHRLAQDPWAIGGLLSLTSVEPWQVLLDSADTVR